MLWLRNKIPHQNTDTTIKVHKDIRPKDVTSLNDGLLFKFDIFNLIFVL